MHTAVGAEVEFEADNCKAYAAIAALCPIASKSFPWIHLLKID
ncbi:hypothetical protein [Trichocoleus desertorum]